MQLMTVQKNFSSQNETVFNLQDSDALTLISSGEAPFFLLLCTQEMQ